MRMELSPVTKLNKQLKSGYKSFADPSELADRSRDFTCALNGSCDLNHHPKDVPLKQLVSGTPYVFDQRVSSPEETDKDRTDQVTLLHLYAVSITFAIGVTIALILHTYLGERLVLVKGAVVSDHELCSAFGHRVLRDGGSSVDAAITAALCLGVVHPHVSGVGGGGVMLVHDIRKNKTRLIDFQGSAPKTLKEEMLQNVSEVKAGLQVGVPGMLRGLHRAHSLYGSLPWEDVVARAAAVAKEGFNVSFSLAEAISKVKGQRVSQRFRDLFFPDGQALRPGSSLMMSSLAGVLEAGLSNFYDGNVSKEMEDEVRANGGVLSREDISAYSVQVEQPLEGLYNEFIIQVPPQPAGAALISALNILEGLHLNENNNTENQTHHWVAEALKEALASGLGDPKYNSSVTQLLSDMLSKNQAEVLRQRINSSHTSAPDSIPSLQTERMTGQVAVMGPDDLMVTVTSSLNTPFGSRIVTASGVILNSLMFNSSWTYEARGQLSKNQKTKVQPGKRILSSLMPVIVMPAGHKCGVYMALSSSGGQQSLSVITQVLISALSSHKERNDSLSLTNKPLVDSEFPEEGEQLLDEEGHALQRVKTNSVQGILRKKDIIRPINVPQLSEGFL
ncbi:glutathione hydrolase 7-like [Gymnodraco acuticeps]|uniref:Glutathione hydrolase n=1 Tax=Gymnodraco acuticeps TaxID=8218 RepID=A0A6P8TV64_GYMAC|nr:glutathione hydrolase 7-like [Gymnodraco acuticeps]